MVSPAGGDCAMPKYVIRASKLRRHLTDEKERRLEICALSKEDFEARATVVVSGKKEVPLPSMPNAFAFRAANASVALDMLVAKFLEYAVQDSRVRLQFVAELKLGGTTFNLIDSVHELDDVAAPALKRTGVHKLGPFYQEAKDRWIVNGGSVVSTLRNLVVEIKRHDFSNIFALTDNTDDDDDIKIKVPDKKKRKMTEVIAIDD